MNKKSTGQKAASIRVSWRKCKVNGEVVDCPLETQSYGHVEDSGVYVIWYWTPTTKKTVRVGQGDIAKRLEDHRQDEAILTYGKFGTLLVTWAPVEASQQDGVELYLANTLNPLVGSNFPDTVPIAVNLPF